ncbi:MAG: PDZ domain-containing protein [Archangium sp.]|nr:PDZ domain-containing protein [Archangium sp.]
MRWVLLVVVAVLAGLVVGVASVPQRTQPMPGEPTDELSPPEPHAALDAQRLETLLDLTARPEVVEEVRSPPAVRLQGTLREVDDERSMALVEVKGRALLVLRGMFIDGWEVETIEQRRIGLRRRGTRHWVAFGDEPASSPAVAPPAVHALQRAELERTLPTLSHRVLQTTRATPVFSNGALRGFRLDFNERSPLLDVGLASGDVIIAVNGQPVTPSLAMDLAGKWQTLHHVELNVERRGQPLSLHYQLN